jgi:hypothetical protein
MANRLRLLGIVLAGLVLAVALALMPSGGTAQAQACDTTGTVDGSADPTTIPPNTPVTFTAWNFGAGENVSYWFTLPDGSVLGTAQPLCCAGGDGYVRFRPDPLPGPFYQFPGRWALTVQGASSNHTSVVYFCVVTQAQPTAPPATNTPVPPAPTDTSVPASPTSVPSTATTPPATPTVEVSPTAAAASPTAEVSPTTAATSPTVEVSPTAAVTTPTAEATAVATTVPTLVPTLAPVATIALPTATTMVQATVMPSPVSVGMPRTGSGSGGGSDMALYVLAVFMGLSLLTVGLLARRASTSRR